MFPFSGLALDISSSCISLNLDLLGPKAHPKPNFISSEVHACDDFPTTHCPNRQGRQLVLTQLLSQALYALHLGQLGQRTQFCIAPVYSPVISQEFQKEEFGF